jgi:phosphoserine phosphatase
MQLTTSKPTTLYLARHGETEYNRLRVMQGRRINASLNEAGREQARFLADRFSAMRLDAVYASTLIRAIQTASRVAEKQPAPLAVRCHPEFDEMSWGIYEGMPPSRELDEMLETAFGWWESGDFGSRVEGGESILDVQQRALAGLQSLLSRHDGQRILLVAHGRLIRVLLASILPGYGLERMNDIGHANTSVNEIIFDGAACKPLSMNCVRHLDALAA